MELDPKYDDYDFPTTSLIDEPGHPGHLKPEEQAQVHQLRMLLEAEGYTKRLDTLTLVGAGTTWRGESREGVSVMVLLTTRI